MPKFYFTYGSHPSFPFSDGWTEVHADNIGQAEMFFRAVHPDIKPGTINCAFVYDESDFVKTRMYNSKFGAKCHEIIGCFTPVDRKETIISEAQLNMLFELVLNVEKGKGLFNDRR